jgi:hypothetical protein
MAVDPRLLDYRFKCAADSGKAYFFQFESTLEPDPYGTVVDRCSRIAKLALPSIALCSSFFVAELEKQDKYLQVGEFPLKGIADAVKIFIRFLQVAPPENYHEKIMDAVNSQDAQFLGFKTRSRVLNAADFRTVSQSPSAHPFLLRELLNIPRLPLFPDQVISRMKAENHLDKSGAARPYIGYLVEWTGTFSSYSRQRDCIKVDLNLSKGSWELYCELYCVSEMLEVIQQLRKGDKVGFRAIIIRIYSTIMFQLDYVEFCNIDRA